MTEEHKAAKLCFRRARLLVTEGNIQAARALFLEAASLYSISQDRENCAYAQAAAGYMSVLCGDIQDGLELLTEAAQAGYSDLEKVDQLAETPWRNKKLRDTEEFKELRALVDRNAHPLKVIRWDSDALDASKWMNFSSPVSLEALRLELPEPPSADEMRRLIYWLEWAHQLFPHDPSNSPTDSNPLTILRQASHDTGFTCREYAILLASVLQANAQPARVLALMKENYHYGYGKGHWATEVWSDSLQKWILLDPQNNCHWKHEGKTLNAHEIREHVLAGNDAKLIAMTASSVRNDMSAWLEHFRAIWIYRNQDFFSHWDYLGEVEEISENPHLLFQGKHRGLFGRHTTEDYLYPKMNQVCFEAKLIDNRIRIILSDSVMLFDQYECRQNDGQWEVCDRDITRSLAFGENRFCFRARNRLGGPCGAAEVVIERQKSAQLR